MPPCVCVCVCVCVCSMCDCVYVCMGMILSSQVLMVLGLCGMFGNQVHILMSNFEIPHPRQSFCLKK